MLNWLSLVAFLKVHASYIITKSILFIYRVGPSVAIALIMHYSCGHILQVFPILYNQLMDIFSCDCSYLPKHIKGMEIEIDPFIFFVSNYPFI